MRFIKGITSPHGVTIATLFSGLLIVGLGIFFAMQDNNTYHTSMHDTVGTTVFADAAMCGDTCNTGIVGESCGTTNAPGTCQNVVSCTGTYTCDIGNNNSPLCNAMYNCIYNDLTGACSGSGGSCENLSNTESVCSDAGCTYEAPLMCTCPNEIGEALCSDTLDNDGDGAQNCEDAGCSDTAFCTLLNTACSENENGMTCAQGAGTCEGNSANIGTCTGDDATSCNLAQNQATCPSGLGCLRTPGYECVTNGGNAQSLCDTSTNGQTYYSTDSANPSDAGEGALCTNGGQATNIVLSGNTWTWSCPNQGGCRATNNFCGDGRVTDLEVCEASDLQSHTCQLEGFNGGTLSCAGTCSAFDTTACEYEYYCDYDDDGVISDAVNCTTTQEGTAGLIACQTDSACQDNSGTCTCQTSVGTDCNDADPQQSTGCNLWYCDYDGDGQLPTMSNCSGNEATCIAGLPQGNTAGCSQSSGPDCDDTDSTIYQGGDEGDQYPGTCNDDKDNDCDGYTDTTDTECSETLFAFYCDYDNDGIASNTINCNDTLSSGQNCVEGPNVYGQTGQFNCYTNAGNDCDDTNASVSTSCEGYYCDFDNDGWTPGTPNCNDTLANCESACQTGGCCSVDEPGDCGECGYDPNTKTRVCTGNNESAINPDATENASTGDTCNDGVDNDCDGSINDISMDCQESSNACTSYSVCQQQQTGLIGGTVFIDGNGDNIQNAGDTLYDGAMVTLYGTDNSMVSQIETSGGGIFQFTNVPLGSYYLGFEKPTGYNFVVPNVGDTGNLESDTDSDANQTTGHTSVFSLTSNGQSIRTYDAGIVQAACDTGIMVGYQTTNASCGEADGAITTTLITGLPSGAVITGYRLKDVATTLKTVSTGMSPYTFGGMAGNTEYSVELLYTSSQGATNCSVAGEPVTVRQDACGSNCYDNAAITIENPTDPTSCNGTDGSVQVSFSTNSSSQTYDDLKYMVQRGTDMPIAYTSALIGNLGAGSYTLWASYTVNGEQCATSTMNKKLSCNGTCDQTATISSVTTNQQTVGQNDGAIELTLEGMTSNTNVQLYLQGPSSSNTIRTGSLGTNPFTFAGLEQGQYSAWAMYSTSDGTACNTQTTAGSVNITVGSAQQTGCNDNAYIFYDANASNLTTSCNVNDGSIAVTFSDTTSVSNIKYYISYGGQGSLMSDQPVFENLAAGNYSIYATYDYGNTQGCNTSTNTQYTNPIEVQLGTVCYLCDNDAYISIVSGSINNESSAGADDGSIELQFNGSAGNTNIVYVYEMGGTMYTSPSPTIAGLAPGTYEAYATYTSASGNACTTIQHPSNKVSFTIGEAAVAGCDDNASIQAYATGESTGGAGDGTISVSHNGIGTPTNYYIKQGQNIVDSDPNGYFSYVYPGTYSVGMEYTSSSGAQGCMVMEDTVYVQPGITASCDPTATVQLSTSNESSCDAQDGSINALFNGAGTAIGYQLYQGTTLLQSNQAGQFTGLAPGTYNVRALYTSSSGASCTASSYYAVTVSEAACASCPDTTLNIQASNETTCGGNDGTVTATLSPAITQAVTYSLIEGTAAIRSNSTGIFTGLAPGSYYVTAGFMGTNQTCTETSSIINIRAAQCGTTCDNAKYEIKAGNESSCNENDGEVVIDAAPNAKQYHLRINGATVSSNSSGSFSSVAPGTYRIEIEYDDCTMLTSSVVVGDAPCSGSSCDTNASVTANITNESTCDANNGGLQGVFSGNGTPTQYTLTQSGSTISSNNTGQFSPLAPGMYMITVNYMSSSNTSCVATSPSITVEEASCVDAGCGSATSNTYSFASEIQQADKCTTGVGGNVGRNLDNWEWQCVGNNTLTCQATIRDRDNDTVLDPDDQCIETPGEVDNNGCPETNKPKRRHTGGSAGSIPTAVCGNGIRDYNEQCDDGNLENLDGCNSSCRLEKQKTEKPAVPLDPTVKIAHKLKGAIKTIQAACEYHDEDYKSKLHRLKDISWEDRYDPSYVLTLYCITKGYKDKFQRTMPTGIGEAIKMVTKVHAIGTNMTFNERGFISGSLPYTDMNATAWYTTYVMYGQRMGILQGLTNSHSNSSHLKALTPISPSQFELLINNAGGGTVPYNTNKDVDDLFDFLGFIEPVSHNSGGMYVTRQHAAEIVLSKFPEKFQNYRYLVGNNLEFYQVLLKKLQTMDGKQQVAYVKKMITKLENANHHVMGQQLQIDVPAIIDFLNEILEEE